MVAESNREHPRTLDRRHFLSRAATLAAAGGAAAYVSPSAVPVRRMPALSAPPSPVVTSVAPSSGAFGTVITIGGSNFGNVVGATCVMVAGGRAFAKPTAVTPTSITAMVGPVGLLGTGPVTVIVGTVAMLPDTMLSLGGVMSTASMIKLLRNGVAGSGGAFTLTTLTPNTVANFSGVVPRLATVSAAINVTGLFVNIGSVHIEVDNPNQADSFDSDITLTFSAPAAAATVAQHLKQQINDNLGSDGVKATVSGPIVTVTRPGSTFISIVYKAS